MSSSDDIKDNTKFNANFNEWFSTDDLGAIGTVDGLGKGNTCYRANISHNNTDMRKRYEIPFKQGEELTFKFDMRTYPTTAVTEILITAMGAPAGSHTSIPTQPADGQWHTYSGKYIPTISGLFEFWLRIYTIDTEPYSYLEIDNLHVKYQPA
ncbi:hypothetical protein GNF76_29160 [Pseudomonas sp. CCM 7893]|uniref:CBM-cenC domain-containing protein n=1 Tax=Pseudomonas spelaei TaxID=1055469 RepID=A0A6I3WDT8_9PSED|nr:hypothetical protein [Pseudomonas spelaei]MUF08397.1 hypothetical protein [Pseudomonas spelaei]